MKPIVAIVGRPNVGKSTLFNKLAGKRIAIVEDTPGVTRDRVYAEATWQRYSFTIIDTGGIEPKASDEILKQMKRQAQLAVETADVILFIVDGKDGLLPADEEVADMLRRSSKPIVLAVNKLDNPKNEEALYDFYALAVGTPIPISAQQALGIGDLLDEIVEHLPDPDAEEDESEAVRIAIVGKPNAGKSTLFNSLLREERSIVSDIPGTTRDAIDTPFDHDGRPYILVDTAGIRRRSKIDYNSIERYSVVRALAAVRRCDVALILVDATQGISEQDTKIAGYVHEEGKASLVIVNKWDLMQKDTNTLHKYEKQLRAELGFMPYAKFMFISAKSGQRVNKIIENVDLAYGQYVRRVSTGLLNDMLGEAVMMMEPPMEGGRRLKIYYATQVRNRPPTIVLFVNSPNLMHFSYQRYLENYLRKSFGFEGTPIRFILRERKEQ